MMARRIKKSAKTTKQIEGRDQGCNSEWNILENKKNTKNYKINLLWDGKSMAWKL